MSQSEENIAAKFKKEEYDFALESSNTDTFHKTKPKPKPNKETKISPIMKKNVKMASRIFKIKNKWP